MMSRVFKSFSVLLFGTGILFAYVPSVFAFNFISPLHDAKDISIVGYFQWQAVSGAAKYVLDIEQFTQSEDNILPLRKCSGGTCDFAFIDLTVGSIEYSDSYTWGITAYNNEGVSIGVATRSVEGESFTTSTFSTEGPPAIIPPPGNGGGPPPPGDGGGGGDGGSPPTLGNPIAAKNITELFNQIFTFLFGLAIFIVPVIVIYAAFLFLGAGGDPEKLQKARTILLWTAIAFILILLSRGLPVVFKNLL